MTGQRRQPTWRVLLRSKWLLLTIVLVASVTTAVVSKLQPPVYAATATLVVNQPASSTASFEVVQANQAFARTLAHLIGSRNVAAAVAPKLRVSLSPAGVQSRMSFSPVNETQLITVTAEDRDPELAREIANAYAATFVDYAASTLPKAAPSSGLSVADQAVLPLSPARPRPTLYTLVALLLSAAGAVAFVLVRSRLDTRLHDIDALTEQFGLPVLGVLPRVELDAVSTRRFEEAVRLLCTTLQHVGNRPLRTLVVTSSSQGEGKSTVAAELAEAYALLSLTEGAVLAVDADLRRPALHLRTGLGDGIERRRGLTSYLAGDLGLAACVVSTPLISLRVLPAGPLPMHPSTLLGFGSSREALLQLRDAADVVVFDTPPLSVGADASLVSAQADGVVLVLDLNRTRGPDLRSSIDQLGLVGATVLGFVINRSRDRNRGGQYSYYREAMSPAPRPTPQRWLRPSRWLRPLRSRPAAPRPKRLAPRGSGRPRRRTPRKRPWRPSAPDSPAR